MLKKDYSFRAASLTDKENIFKCINEAYKIERDDPIIGFKKTDRFVDLTEIEAQFRVGHYLCCINLDSKKLVGVIFYKISVKEGYIGPLAVFPDQQKKGIATSLIHSVESKMIQQGVKKITMRVVSTRTDLFPYYEKRGYQITERTIDPKTIGLTKDKLTKKVTVFRLTKLIV